MRAIRAGIEAMSTSSGLLLEDLVAAQQDSRDQECGQHLHRSDPTLAHDERR